MSAFLAASEALIAALERLSDGAATHTPAGGGWSAAQIGCHVATTNDTIAGVLTGAIPRARPAPAGFQENPDVFSAVPPRVKTAASLEPPADVTREQALQKLRDSTAQAVRAIEGLSAQRALGEVVDSPFGVISLYQLAEFLGSHVVRHQAQLQRATAEL